MMHGQKYIKFINLLTGFTYWLIIRKHNQMSDY